MSSDQIRINMLLHQRIQQLEDIVEGLSKLILEIDPRYISHFKGRTLTEAMIQKFLYRKKEK